MENVGSFSMRYLISGGEDDGKTFNISFRRCTDDDWAIFHMDRASDEDEDDVKISR